MFSKTKSKFATSPPFGGDEALCAFLMEKSESLFKCAKRTFSKNKVQYQSYSQNKNIEDLEPFDNVLNNFCLLSLKNYGLVATINYLGLSMINVLTRLPPSEFENLIQDEEFLKVLKEIYPNHQNFNIYLLNLNNFEKVLENKNELVSFVLYINLFHNKLNNPNISLIEDYEDYTNLLTSNDYNSLTLMFKKQIYLEDEVVDLTFDETSFQYSLNIESLEINRLEVNRLAQIPTESEELYDEEEFFEMLNNAKFERLEEWAMAEPLEIPAITTGNPNYQPVIINKLPEKPASSWFQEERVIFKNASESEGSETIINKNVIVQGDSVTEQEPTPCCIRGLLTNQAARQLADFLESQNWIFENVTCYVNTCKTIISSLDPDDKRNVFATDYLMKIRHNTFANWILKNVLHTEQGQLDIPLNKYGIQTNKTPDFVTELKNKNGELISIKIYEFSVTSASDLSGFRKGTMEDSKYNHEIELLSKLQKPIIATYYPIILQLDRPTKDNHTELKTMLQLDFSLEEFNKLKTGIKEVTDYFFKNLSSLFAYNKSDFHHSNYENVVLERNLTHSRTKFFSSNTTNKHKIARDYRLKILELAKNFASKQATVSICYDLKTTKISLTEDDRGILINDLEDWAKNVEVSDYLANHIKLKSITEMNKEVKEFGFKDKTTSPEIPLTTYDPHANSFLCNVITQETALRDVFKMYAVHDPLEKLKIPEIPAPFDFDDCYNELLSTIDKPTNKYKNLLINNRNDSENQRRIYKSCLKTYNEANIKRGNIIYAPKSSFLGFFTPEFNHSRDLYETPHADFYDFVIKNCQQNTQSILLTAKNTPLFHGELAHSISQFGPLEQQALALKQRTSECYNIWRQTPQFILAKKGEVKLKDINTSEAINYRKAERDYKIFAEKYSTATRTLKSKSGSCNYVKVKLRKDVKRSIEIEMRRDHNAHAHKGVGNHQTASCLWTDKNLTEYITSFGLSLFTTRTEPTCKFKTQFEGYHETNEFCDNFKNHCVEEIVSYEDKMSHNYAGSSLLFTQHVYKSVLFLSNVPMKDDQVAVDSLFCKDTILMVKGGAPAVDSTRKFKLIFKTMENASNLYNCFRDGQQSWNVFTNDHGETFLETPWISMYIPMAEHFFLAKTKFSSYYLTMSEESNTNDLSCYVFPLILMFNGRRKVEELLHAYRQLFMNFRGEYAKVDDYFKSIVEYNRDYIYRFSVLFILNSFKGLLTSNDTFQELISSNEFKEPAQWCIYLYASRLLPKAASDPTAELRNDIKKHFKDYETLRVDSKTKMSDFVINDVNSEDPFESGLKYSPKLSYLIGCCVSDHIKNTEGTSQFINGLSKVMSTNIFSVANNKGCRMNPDQSFEIVTNLDSYLEETEEVLNNAPVKSSKKSTHLFTNIEHNIFGKKGYQASYETRPNINAAVIEKAINAPGPTSASVILNKDKTTLYSFWKNNQNIRNLSFSIHAKVQWGGARQIYAPTVDTKIYQQLGEGIFKHLCKSINIEMISIPSSKRSMFLNTLIHERGKRTEESWYMNYDYTKWGPGANFEKYKYFIMGLIDIIPESIFVFLMQMCDAMLEKRIIIRRIDFAAVCKHPEYKEIIKNCDLKFFKDYVSVAYPQSFVMGIWNYLSSAFHAGAIMLFRHGLHNSKTMKRFDDTYDFYAVPHSDDMLGVINCTKRQTLEHIAACYEIFSKCVNHIQSNKKCIITRKDSEVISIVRINNRVVTMLPKFSGSITVSPSYSGYVGEMKSLVGKSLELISNGATLMQTYKLYRIMVYFLTNQIYNMAMPRYDLPLEALGTPDEMPLYLVLYGGQSNFLINHQYSKEMNLKFQQKVMEVENFDFQQGISYIDNTRNLQIKYRDRIMENFDETMQNLISSDTILMNKFDSDSLCKLQFISRMSDKRFAHAMASQHLQGGISYLLRNNAKFVYTYQGDSHVPWCMREKIYNEFLSMDTPEIDNAKLVDMIAVDFQLLENLPSKLQFKPSGTSLKPCSLTYTTTVVRGMERMSYQKISSYLTEIEYRNLIPLKQSEMQTISTFENITQGLSLFEKLLIAENMCESAKKIVYLYATLPTDKRCIENRSDLLYFLQYNCRRGFMIKNISTNMFPDVNFYNVNQLDLAAPQMLFNLMNLTNEEGKLKLWNNYRFKYGTRYINSDELCREFQTSTEASKQASLYHFQFIKNEQLRILESPHYTSLPLMDFTKRSAGSGLTWFGKCTLKCRTPYTIVLIHLDNNVISNIEINVSARDSDLAYFLTQLQMTGVRNPLTTKCMIPYKSDDLVVGFHDPFSLSFRIGPMKDFKYYCNLFKFKEFEPNYPNLKIIKTFNDIKCIINGNKYRLKLSNKFDEGSIDSFANLEGNKALLKEIFDVEDHYIQTDRITYEFSTPINIMSFKTLHLYGCYLPSEQVYQAWCNHNSTKTEKTPMYGMYETDLEPIDLHPNFKTNLITNMFTNYGEAIRTIYGNRLYNYIFRNYPGSFTQNLALDLSRGDYSRINQVYNKICQGDEQNFERSEVKLSKALDLISVEDMKHPLNTKTLIERFKNDFNHGIVLGLSSLLEALSLHDIYGLNVNIFLLNLLFNFEESNLPELLISHLYLKLKQTNINRLKRTLSDLPKPLNMLIDDPNHIIKFWYHIIQNFSKVFNNVFGDFSTIFETHITFKHFVAKWHNRFPKIGEDDQGTELLLQSIEFLYGNYCKSSSIKIPKLKYHCTETLFLGVNSYKVYKKKVTSDLPIEESQMGVSKLTRALSNLYRQRIDIESEHGKSLIKQHFEEIQINVRIVRNPTPPFNKRIEQTRDTILTKYFKKRSEYSEAAEDEDEDLGYERDAPGVALIGNDYQPLKKNSSLIGYIYGTPYKSYYIKHLAFPKMEMMFRNTGVLVQPDCTKTFTSLHDHVVFKNLTPKDGELLTWEEANHLDEIINNNFLKTGEIPIQGDSQLMFRSLQTISKELEAVRDLILDVGNSAPVYVSLFGTKINLTSLKEVSSSTYDSRLQKGFNIYEPLGTSINMKPLECLFKDHMFPKSYNHLLNGTILFTRRKSNDIFMKMRHLRKNRDDWVTAMMIVRSILKSTINVPSNRELSSFELRVAEDLYNELSDLIETDPDYSEEHFVTHRYDFAAEAAVIGAHYANTGITENSLSSFKLSCKLKVNLDLS
uniref:RNA-directed RNA polymerase L n=1 Tax=Soybean cyst nematode bunya-like virus TaxID=2107711 RepID=A0A2P1CXW4_9VIRU|nr:RNA-dependent RNA polymerase [Soybean cyst nematode bunya-like virus]